MCLRRRSSAGPEPAARAGLRAALRFVAGRSPGLVLRFRGPVLRDGERDVAEHAPGHHVAFRTLGAEPFREAS
ncbi:hypothetical protein GCM10010398_28120 [Streptomyces fimbriatus]